RRGRRAVRGRHPGAGGRPPPGRAKALADRGVLFGAIAAALRLDRNTVTAAWRFWHESRGLPVPDGRATRLYSSRTKPSRAGSRPGGTPGPFVGHRRLFPSRATT